MTIHIRADTQWQSASKLSIRVNDAWQAIQNFHSRESTNWPSGFVNVQTVTLPSSNNVNLQTLAVAAGFTMGRLRFIMEAGTIIGSTAVASTAMTTGDLSAYAECTLVISATAYLTGAGVSAIPPPKTGTPGNATRVEGGVALVVTSVPTNNTLTIMNNGNDSKWRLCLSNQCIVSFWINRGYCRRRCWVSRWHRNHV